MLYGFYFWKHSNDTGTDAIGKFAVVIFSVVLAVTSTLLFIYVFITNWFYDLFDRIDNDYNN